MGSLRAPGGHWMARRAVASARQVLAALRAADARFVLRPESVAALGSLCCAVSAAVVAGGILTGGCGPRATARPSSSLPAPESGTANPEAPLASTAARDKPKGSGRAVHMTLYHIAAQKCPDPGQVPLPRCGGGSIAMVSPGFKQSAAMQGSAKLCDGRVVGVQKVNPLCFVVVGAEFPWGITASGRPATPFRSIAIDRKSFVMGHWYYVPELDGLALPAPAAGKVHDGCVRADDVGGAVKGDMVDFFVGEHGAVDALKGKLSEAMVHLVDGESYCQQPGPL
jgi:3D (Asp-Asp-Asp) domain-containing protein